MGNFSVRDFVEQSGFSICDPCDVLATDSGVSIVDSQAGRHFRHNLTGGVDLGGIAWGSFEDMLNLNVTGFNLNRRDGHLTIEVDC